MEESFEIAERTKDEITLRTPDALINGSGVISVIQSCIPSIVDPWAMPSIDVDACLIAIRIASYGEDMNISSNCPKCKHTNEHTIELNHALEQITLPDYSKTVDEAGLKIKLRPQNYFATNKANSITYKEQRILEVLNATDASPEDRETNLKSITEELIELNVDILAASTEYILTEDGAKVIDSAFIKEFYSNTSSANIRRVQERLAEIGKDAGLKPYNTTCEECKHEYKTEVTFDYANFFANGS
jgi:phage FluMu protein Com